LVKSQLLYQLS